MNEHTNERLNEHLNVETAAGQKHPLNRTTSYSLCIVCDDMSNLELETKIQALALDMDERDRQLQITSGIPNVASVIAVGTLVDAQTAQCLLTNLRTLQLVLSVATG